MQNSSKTKVYFTKKYHNALLRILMTVMLLSTVVTMLSQGFYSTRPAKNWQESLITGNGIMGAMIEGNPAAEHIVINHSELYMPLNPIMLPPSQGKHLSEIRQMMFRGEYRRASQFVVDLANSEGYHVKHASDAFVPAFRIDIERKVTNFNDYSRGVDFSTGEAWVRFRTPNGEYENRVFASRADSIVVVRLTAKKGTINTRLHLKRVVTADSVRRRKFKLDFDDLLSTEMSGRQDSSLFFRAQFKIPEEGVGHKGYDGYEGVVSIVKSDGHVWFDGSGFCINDATDVLLTCHVRMTRDFSKSGVKDLCNYLNSLPNDYGTLLTHHVAIHKPLFERVRLDLGITEEERALSSEQLLAKGGKSKALIERIFQSARYNVISATGLHAPNLQGIWGATMTPPWSGDFTTNGNLPTAISHYLQANTPELMLPLFDQLDSMMDDFRANARILYGCQGIHVPSHFTWHGYDNQFDATWPMTFWHAGAPWYALFYYDYYLYTQDREFLRNRALPFMQEAVLFLEDFLQKDSTGTLCINPSYSPENAPKGTKDQACINATMDVAASRMLLRAIIDASNELGTNKEKIATWDRMLNQLPPYQLNANGELREWLWNDLKDNHQHRHSSHLIGLYDLHDHILIDNPALREGCIRTIDRRMDFRRKEDTGVMAFGICQLAFSAAALGQSSMCEEMIGWLGDNYFLSNLFSTHDPHDKFNCDISGGYPSLVMKMLCYSEPGLIQLLPAKPDSWKKGSIDGMALRGGIIMKHLEWDGKKISATLFATHSQKVTIMVGDKKVATVNLKSNKDKTLKY